MVLLQRIVFCDLDLLFEGKIIEILTFLKRDVLAQKCVEELLDFDICHHKMHIDRFGYLPTNDIIAKFTLWL